MDLETVKVLMAWDSTSSDCCTDLTKVLVDWTMADSERG